VVEALAVRVTRLGQQLRPGGLNGLAADLYKRLEDNQVIAIEDKIRLSCQSKTPAAWWSSMTPLLHRYRVARR